MQICSPATDTVRAIRKTVSGAQGVRGGTQGMLLDEFSVGKCLGRGSFGVVSNCTRRSTGEELAVKVVDMAMVTSDRIRREAEILSGIDHESIVRLHGCFHHGRDARFFCLVMDRYEGGDLIDGLERRGAAVGCNEAAHIVRQVARGIQYLHRSGILHRDIKGENVLFDRPSVTDPTARCAITDFGAATRWTQGQRLEDHTGTRLFWSPEFYDRSYADKVDVWALGIVAYSLVTFRLPFSDEQDIRWKQAELSDAVDQGCADLICWTLQKREEMRPSIDEVVCHSWLASAGISDADDARSCVDEEEDAPLLELTPRAREAAWKEDAPSPFSAPTSAGCSYDSLLLFGGHEESFSDGARDECEASPERGAGGLCGSVIGWTLQRVGAQLSDMIDADKGGTAKALNLVVPEL